MNCGARFCRPMSRASTIAGAGRRLSGWTHDAKSSEDAAVTPEERAEFRRRAGHLSELIAQALDALGRDEDDLHQMFAARVLNRLYAAAEGLDIVPIKREHVIRMVRTNGKRLALARA